MPEEIFFFVNPTSGGNKGAAFLKAPNPFPVSLPDGREIAINIYSLLDGEPGDKPGFKALRQATARSSTPIRMIVGGGDGTVMWADSECEKHGIDSTTQVLVGIVPLGTGNDFARSYGWGGKNPKNILKNDCQTLRDLAVKWATAKPHPHDVWDVTLHVRESDGQVMKVNHDRDEEATGKASVTAPMVNYFSIGQESKAGIDFDKLRTKSQVANLLVYAFTGVSTELSCFNKWDHIGSVVGSLHHGTSIKDPIIFNQDQEDEFPDLVGNPESLMFLNINSYAGGNCHFWNLENDVGVDPEPDDAGEVDVEQDAGDGRLEVVTVPNLIALGLDRAMHASKRVFSGAPFYIKFEDDDDTPDELEAWCEIDGEFYHLINPSFGTIVLKKRLNVLRCPDKA